RVRDDGLDYLVGILGAAADEIKNASGKTCLVQDLGDDRMGARTRLRGTENNGVTADDGVGHGSSGKYSGAVPWCHAEDDACRLPHGHRERARLVGWNGLTLDLCREASGLAE